MPPAKKLLFLYVANEAIQRNAKTQPELVRAFSRVLADAIEHIVRYAGHCTCVCTRALPS